MRSWRTGSKYPGEGGQIVAKAISAFRARMAPEVRAT